MQQLLACHQLTSSCNSYNSSITEGQTSKWIRLMRFKLTVNVFGLSPHLNPSPKSRNKYKTHSFRDDMTAYAVKLLNIKNYLTQRVNVRTFKLRKSKGISSATNRALPNLYPPSRSF